MPFTPTYSLPPPLPLRFEPPDLGLYRNCQTLMISPRLCSKDTGGFNYATRSRSSGVDVQFAHNPRIPSRFQPGCSQCTPLLPHSGPGVVRAFHIGNSRQMSMPFLRAAVTYNAPSRVVSEQCAKKLGFCNDKYLVWDCAAYSAIT